MIFLSLLVGLLSGVSSNIFLYSLDLVTQFRESHPQIIWLLPAIGFFIGWIYWKFGNEANKGNYLIFEEIHSPKKVLPLRMAPLVYVSTVLTHWFGGSAGREGTAVQMSASLADQLAHYFKISVEQRRNLLRAGLGAGFGSAVGAPWAGMIFGLEVVFHKKIIFQNRLESCLIAGISSWVGYLVTWILKAPHSQYLKFSETNYSLKNFLYVILAALIFGVMARLFSFLTHHFEDLLNRFIKYPPFKPLLGGFLIVVFYFFEGSYRYAGLGISWIQNALQFQVDFSQTFFKTFFTVLTVGSGFKGGEFIPLVFIGSTLGSALSLFFPVSVQLLSTVGFSAVFAAVAKVPLACSVMAIELFGWSVAPYALLACFISYFVSGTTE